MFTPFIPTPKQLELLKNITSYRYIALSGAVRSSKTLGILIGLPLLIQKHKGNLNIICTVSLKAFEQNILIPLEKMYPQKGWIKYTKNSGVIYIFNQRFNIVTYNDSKSYTKLQGASISLAIVDEVVLAPENFFNMLRTRLDLAISQAIFTCNPGSANHYFKKWLDDPNIEKFFMHYSILDNPHLPQKVIDDLIKSYERNPSFKKRYIEGEWTDLEGLACYAFDRDRHIIDINNLEFNKSNYNPKNLKQIIIGIDGANMNDCTTVVPIIEDRLGNLTIYKSFIHDPKKSQILSNTQQVELIEQYFNELRNELGYNKHPIKTTLVIDCAASDLYLQLYPIVRKYVNWFIIKFTKKEIKTTIDVMNNTFTTKNIKILNSLDYNYKLKEHYEKNYLLEELQSVRIKETVNGITLDPSDPNDAFDALRYGLAYGFKFQ